MSDHSALKKPDGVEPFNFAPRTHGGSAFRDWYMLYKHRGVFVGFHNHDWTVLFSSDPNAEWSRAGCYDSCSNGDARPQSKTAKLIRFHDLPEGAKPLALQWVAEAKIIVVEAAKERLAAEAKKKADLAAQYAAERKRTVDDPWLAAVSPLT